MAFSIRSRPQAPQPPEAPSAAHKGRGMESTDGSVASKAGRPVLLSFDDMPKWFQIEGNQWVLQGYRPISGSIRASLHSWTYLHNESANIYTHLVPSVLYLLGEYYLQQYLVSVYSEMTNADFIVSSIFMFSAATCLALSATYHTLMNHSQPLDHFCLRLDLLGVLIFILGDLTLNTYLIFWCETSVRNFYWTLFGVFGTYTIYVTMHPKYQGAKHRFFRTLVFLATGLTGLGPFIHGISVFGMSLMMKKALPYTLAKAVCLLSGTWFYVSKWPESRYPGKFDLWGSHAIWHSLVVIAALFQSAGYLNAFDYAQAEITCPAL